MNFWRSLIVPFLLQVYTFKVAQNIPLNYRDNTIYLICLQKAKTAWKDTLHDKKFPNKIFVWFNNCVRRTTPRQCDILILDCPRQPTEPAQLMASMEIEKMMPCNYFALALVFAQVKSESLIVADTAICRKVEQIARKACFYIIFCCR